MRVRHLFIAALLFFTGCFHHKQPVLRIGNATEPATLDPQLAPGLTEGKIVSALFEGLFVPSSRDLKPMPGVAKSYSISNDRKVYTFSLREDAVWNNGDSVVAKDFVNAVRRGLSVTLGSPWAELYFVLKNAKRYYDNEIVDFSKVGIHALDEHTLQITLNEPIDYLPSLLMHWAWSPVHKKSIQQFGGLCDRDNRWTRIDNIVANGPYSLQAIEVGNKIVVKKSKTYWDREHIAIDEVHFLSNVDASTEENMFVAGQLDITDNVPADKIDQYRSKGLLKSSTTLGSSFFWFNCKRAPFDDVRVRRALSLAIDRNAIGQLRRRGPGFEAYALVPPGTMNYDANRNLFSDDVDLAKQLLLEAGYSAEHPFPQVTLLYNSSANWKLLAEAAQEMWRKNLGIQVNLQGIEWGIFLNERRAHNFDMCRGGWIGDYNDATTFLDMLRSESANNHAQWKSEKYDQLLDQAKTEPDSRISILAEAENLMIEDMPILPLYYDSICHLVSKNIGGWHANILDWHS